MDIHINKTNKSWEAVYVIKKVRQLFSKHRVSKIVLSVWWRSVCRMASVAIYAPSKSTMVIHLVSHFFPHHIFESRFLFVSFIGLSQQTLLCYLLVSFGEDGSMPGVPLKAISD